VWIVARQRTQVLAITGRPEPVLAAGGCKPFDVILHRSFPTQRCLLPARGAVVMRSSARPIKTYSRQAGATSRCRCVIRSTALTPPSTTIEPNAITGYTSAARFPMRQVAISNDETTVTAAAAI